MATFFITVQDDRTYTRILESIIQRSLTHCKSTEGTSVKLEVIGSVEDYKFFEKEIFLINSQRGFPISSITEAV